MSQIETVQQINNPAFKTGMGKNGKQWTLAQVTTNKNNLTTVFAPIEVGDKVELTWNDQFGNWSAKKVNAQQIAQDDKLRKLWEQNLAIFKAVTGEDYGKHTQVVDEKPKLPQSQVGNPHIGDQADPVVTTEDVDNFDMSQIPF